MLISNRTPTRLSAPMCLSLLLYVYFPLSSTAGNVWLEHHVRYTSSSKMILNIKGNWCIIREVHSENVNLIPIGIMCNIHYPSEETCTVSPVRLELTPSCVAPNHPRGLYYKGLAAHLTPRRGRGAGGEIGTSAPLSFHMVEHHTQYRSTNTHTHAEVARVCSAASVCYTR